MSGYDKSSDYGGPPPTWRTVAGALILLGAALAFALYAASQA